VNLRRGVVRGVFSLGGARIVSNLLGAGSILILARLLTPEDFGIVAIATAVLTVVQSCTELSLNNALIQKEEVDRSHIDTAWTIALIRAVLIILFFLVAAWPLSQVYANIDMVPVFIVSGITGALIGFQNPWIWLVTKEMRFAPLALVQFSQKAVAVVLGVALAINLESYWAIIIANALGALFAGLLSYVLIPYWPRFSLVRAGEIWAFSGWMFFNQLFETLNWRIDQLIIGMVVPKAQLGIYAVADNLAVIPTRESIQPIRHALFPGMANLSQDLPRLSRSHLLAQSSIAMLIAPLGVGLALVAEPAVAVALGNQWEAAVPFVQIGAVYYSLGTFSMGLQPVAMALAKTKLLFIRQVIAVFIKIPLIVGGLLAFGLVGAALGRLISEFVTVLVEFLFLRNLLKLPVSQQLRHHALTICGLLVMAAGLPLIEGALASINIPVAAELALTVLCGGLLYVGTLAVVWLVTGRPSGPLTELMGSIARMTGKGRERRMAEL
jgi:O-antigen/teichoic acid export membrane protein